MRYTMIQCDISVAALENAIVHLVTWNWVAKDKKLTLVCNTNHTKFAHEAIDILQKEQSVFISVVGLDALPRDVWFVTDGHEVVMCGDR